MIRYILKNNLFVLVMVYIIPLLCINLLGERYEGEGDFVDISFVSFFFYTPGIVIQFILMVLCNYIFKRKKRYASLALILLLCIDLLLTLFLLLLFGSMKEYHSVGFVLHVMFSKTLYWTLSLIICKLYMLIRLFMLYCREYPNDVYA